MLWVILVADEQNLRVQVHEVYLLPEVGVIADATIIGGVLQRGVQVRIQSSGEVATVGKLEKNFFPVQTASLGDHVGIRLDFPFKVAVDTDSPNERNFHRLIRVPDELIVETGSAKDQPAIAI